jgi:cysteinyl-tRNA synthetase
VEKGTGESATKVWEKEDLELYAICHESRTAGMVALKRDMDGAEYLKRCLHIVTAGNGYLSNRGRQTSPAEPIGIALSTLREMLELVGFSERTTRAGLSYDGVNSHRINQVAGGEGSVVDALVKFRSAVRRSALQDAKSGRGTENTVSILALSDRLRDEDLPRIGIEVLDEKTEKVHDSWRFCVPRVKEQEQTDEDSSTTLNDESIIDMGNVSAEDFFRLGQYAGMFSKYNTEGVPTHNADGSEVSKRATKKMLKKRDSYFGRLANKGD